MGDIVLMTAVAMLIGLGAVALTLAIENTVLFFKRRMDK